MCASRRPVDNIAQVSIYSQVAAIASSKEP